MSNKIAEESQTLDRRNNQRKQIGKQRSDIHSRGNNGFTSHHSFQTTANERAVKRESTKPETTIQKSMYFYTLIPVIYLSESVPRFQEKLGR